MRQLISLEVSSETSLLLISSKILFSRILDFGDISFASSVPMAEDFSLGDYAGIRLEIPASCAKSA